MRSLTAKRSARCVRALLSTPPRITARPINCNASSSSSDGTTMRVDSRQPSNSERLLGVLTFRSPRAGVAKGARQGVPRRLG